MGGERRPGQGTGNRDRQPATGTGPGYRTRIPDPVPVPSSCSGGAWCVVLDMLSPRVRRGARRSKQCGRCQDPVSPDQQLPHCRSKRRAVVFHARPTAQVCGARVAFGAAALPADTAVSPPPDCTTRELSPLRRCDAHGERRYGVQVNVWLLQLSPVSFHVLAQSPSVVHSRVQYFVLSVVLRRAHVPVQAQSAPEEHVL